MIGHEIDSIVEELARAVARYDEADAEVQAVRDWSSYKGNAVDVRSMYAHAVVTFARQLVKAREKSQGVRYAR